MFYLMIFLRFVNLHCRAKLASFFIFFPSASFALCVIDGVPAGSIVYPMDNSPIIFSDAAQLGSVVGTFRMYNSVGQGGVSVLTCNNKSVVSIKSPLPVMPNWPNVYPTNIAGLGVKFLFRSGILSAPITPTPQLWGGEIITAQLIKTQAIPSGKYTLSGMQLQWLDTVGGASILFWQVSSIPVLAISHTCSVSMPMIAVPLGTMNQGVFKEIGSKSVDVPFNVQLNCGGGAASSVTKVYTTFTDSTNPNNTSNNLPLSKDSTASGLAVQFINRTNNTLVGFGADSSITGNKNQIYLGDLVGTAGNGLMTYPFAAHYIRTGAVVGGSANSSATFTMSYN